MNDGWNALRKRAVSASIQLFFEGLSRASRMSPASRQALSSVRVLPDIPYGSSAVPEQHLDIYLPRKQGGLRPAVLYLHGGGFRMLSRKTHWLMALQFARNGYVVFNADYRLAPEHPFPAALQDAAMAFEWVVHNAARYGADLHRLVLAGESAGGNLVTSLTIAACFDRPEACARRVFELETVPAAIAPMCPMLLVSDPTHYWETRHVPLFYRDRIEAVCEGYVPRGIETPGVDLADPLRILESDAQPARPLPPVFCGVGTADPILVDTQRLEQALRRRGVPASIRYYDGEPHAFHALLWKPHAREAWQDTFAFLDRHLAGRVS